MEQILKIDNPVASHKFLQILSFVCGCNNNEYNHVHDSRNKDFAFFFIKVINNTINIYL